MGILDDTVHDAAQPLPKLTLRRMGEDADPDSIAAAPADDGEALTVFRLQKDGGTTPPMAPPAPRAVDAGALAAGPLHAPVGDFIDASLQFVTSIDGLETGKGPARTRNSDATDRQQRLVSPDSSHRLDYVVSTGSSDVSRQVPSPFDDPGKLVQRIDSSDGMRRATGRGAPSGEPSGELGQAPSEPPTQAPGDAASEILPRSPARSASAAPAPAGPAQPDPAATHSAVQAPQPATRAAVATNKRPDPASPAAPQPVSSRLELPGHAQARTPSPTPAGPRLSIGRIEVTVLSAPPPVAKPATTPGDAFLSKHYLRRL